MDTIGTLSIGKLAIQLTTPLLLRKRNRANFSHVSRGFVSESWPFLLIFARCQHYNATGIKSIQNSCQAQLVSLSILRTSLVLCYVTLSLDVFIIYVQVTK